MFSGITLGRLWLYWVVVSENMTWGYGDSGTLRKDRFGVATDRLTV